MYFLSLIIFRSLYPQGNRSSEPGMIKVITRIGFRTVDSYQIEAILFPIYHMGAILASPRRLKPYRDCSGGRQTSGLNLYSLTSALVARYQIIRCVLR